MKKTKAPNLKTDEAKRLWRAVLRDYDLDEAGVEKLRAAVISYDNFLHFQDVLAKSGPIYKSRDGLIKRNPLVDMIRTERAGFLASMQQLDLESDDEPKRGPGRPPGRF